MKPFNILLSAALLAVPQLSPAADSTPTSRQAERIGIYDSRVIAYAHFWSAPEQRKLKEAFAAGKEAQAKGDTNRLEQVKAQMQNRQEQSHLQVFSTAPVDDALATIKDQVERTRKEAGVSRIVSKWNKEELKHYQEAEKIDVTDQLLAAFSLDEKHKKVIADIRTKEPLPLDEAKKLMKEGKL